MDFVSLADDIDGGGVGCLEMRDEDRFYLVVMAASVICIFFLMVCEEGFLLFHVGVKHIAVHGAV